MIIKSRWKIPAAFMFVGHCRHGNGLFDFAHARRPRARRRHYAHKETYSINRERVITHDARLRACMSVKKSGQG